MSTLYISEPFFVRCFFRLQTHSKFDLC